MNFSEIQQFTWREGFGTGYTSTHTTVKLYKTWIYTALDYKSFLFDDCAGPLVNHLYSNLHVSAPVLLELILVVSFWVFGNSNCVLGISLTSGCSSGNPNILAIPTFSWQSQFFFFDNLGLSLGVEVVFLSVSRRGLKFHDVFPASHIFSGEHQFFMVSKLLVILLWTPGY